MNPMTDTPPTPDTSPQPVAEPHVTSCPNCGFETVHWHVPGGDPNMPQLDACPSCGHTELDTRKGHAPMPDRPIYRCGNCASVYHDPAERCGRCGGPAPELDEYPGGGKEAAAVSGTGVSAPPPSSTRPVQVPKTTPTPGRRPTQRRTK